MATAKKEAIVEESAAVEANVEESKEAANEATPEETPAVAATPAPNAEEIRSQATPTSYQPYTPPQTDGGSFRKGFIAGAISALVLSTIVVLSNGTDQGLIDSLEADLATTQSAYLGLQVEVAENQVTSLNSQLGEIEAAEAQLTALVAEKQATVEKLAAANLSLAELLDTKAEIPAVEAPVVEEAAAAESNQVNEVIAEEPPAAIAEPVTEANAEAAPVVEALAEDTAVLATEASAAEVEKPVIPAAE